MAARQRSPTSTPAPNTDADTDANIDIDIDSDTDVEELGGLAVRWAGTFEMVGDDGANSVEVSGRFEGTSTSED